MNYFLLAVFCVLLYFPRNYYLDVLTGVRPRMKDHYRAHHLSLWMRLIPELHRAGASSSSLRHNLFLDHNNSNLYEGVVRPDPQYLLTEDTKAGASTANSKSEQEPTEIPTTVCITTETNKFQLNTSEPLGPWDISGYQQYSTALTVTIAIGCSLLILNILIFAKVYRKKDKTKRSDAKSSFEDTKLLPSASVVAEIERENVLLSGSLHKASSQHSIHKQYHYVSSQGSHLPSHHAALPNHLPFKAQAPPNGSVHQYMSPPESHPLLAGRLLPHSQTLPHPHPSTGSVKCSSVVVSEMRV